MKAKRTFGILFGAILLTMTATGCKGFPGFSLAELNEIEVLVTPFKSFVKDDRFEDCADLKVKGYYSNGTSKIIDKSEVELLYISYDTGIGYDINRPIPEGGQYTVRARYKNFQSELYDFSVEQYHTYATGFETTESEEIAVAPGGNRTIALSVAPSNYTERLDIVVDDPTIASISRRTDGSIIVDGLRAGRTAAHFYAFTNPKDISIRQDLIIIVDAFYVQKIEVLNAPSSLFVGETIQVQLKVSPSHHTYPVDATISGSGRNFIKIDKKSDELWEVTGLTVGHAGITFKAQKSSSSYTYASLQLEVKDVYATSISVKGPSTFCLETTHRIYLTIEPSNYTSDTGFYHDFDRDIVEVEKENPTTFKVVCLKEGVTSIKFYAKKSASEYIIAELPVVAKDVFATSLVVNCPSNIKVGTSAYVSLTIAPSDYNHGVYYSISKSKSLSIERVDSRKYKITGLKPCEVDLRFAVEKSLYYDIEVDAHIKIYGDTISKTTIKQFYKDIDGLNKTYPVCPSTGTIRMLVIPVWFFDSNSFIGGEDTKQNKVDPKIARDNMYDDIVEAFTGDESTTGWESVITYFEKDSGNKLHIVPIVSEWYECGFSTQTYIDDESERTLVKDAVDTFFVKNKKFKRKDFDSDGDGYIDLIYLVHAASDSGNYQYPNLAANDHKFWGHATYYGNKNLKNEYAPGPNRYCISNFTGMYNQNNAKDRLGSKYSKCHNPYATIDATTMVHEIGHTFGLMDYYDDHYDWTGGFNMQHINGLHDPYSAMALGWSDPYIPKKSCVLTINDFATSHECIVLTPQWNSYSSPFDEYLVLELLSPDGINNQMIPNSFKTPLKKAGIRLWHVNAWLYNKTSKAFTNNAKWADYNGFNNQLNSLCPAYELNKKYQDYRCLRLIRHDANANTQDAVTNWVTDSLQVEHTFQVGDTFSMQKYNRQFLKFYDQLEKTLQMYNDFNIPMSPLTIELLAEGITPTLDFGKELGWEFEVLTIESIGNGKWNSSIKLTKTA